MTTALCLNCGSTKFGAFCPCPQCQAPATGNQGLDINFSDHRMTVPSLDRLGGIIKTIRTMTDDDQVVFWTFISYMSSHPSDVLQADPPPEMASAVSELRSKITLPIVELELKEIEDRGPPMSTVKAPPNLFDAYQRKHGFLALASIQVRDASGAVSKAILMEGDEGPIIAIPDDSGVVVDKIVAIRKTPGCLLGWLIRPPWLT